jgi:hypothetical protein
MAEDPNQAPTLQEANRYYVEHVLQLDEIIDLHIGRYKDKSPHGNS